MNKWKRFSLLSENGIVKINKMVISKKGRLASKQWRQLQTPTSNGWHFSNRKLDISKQKAQPKASQLWLKHPKWNPNICQQKAASHLQFLMPTWPSRSLPPPETTFPCLKTIPVPVLKYSSVPQWSSYQQFPCTRGVWPSQYQLSAYRVSAAGSKALHKVRKLKLQVSKHKSWARWSWWF